MYDIEYSADALTDIARLKRSEPKRYEKLGKLIEELRVHPTTGIGHPEPLRGMNENVWSRQISKKHRLVYAIYERRVVVCVLSAYGHYDDK